MGKKKKRKLEQKPYCWYCTREFDDEKILIQHQKAKHFKCHICHKKLTTAGGMVVHVYQVHKENITKVPNAKPGRDSIQYEIYGMEGIPDESLTIGEKGIIEGGDISINYPMQGTIPGIQSGLVGAPVQFPGQTQGTPSTAPIPGATASPMTMGIPPSVPGTPTPSVISPQIPLGPLGPNPMVGQTPIGMVPPMWVGPNPPGMGWMPPNMPPRGVPPPHTINPQMQGLSSPPSLGGPVSGAPLFPVAGAGITSPPTGTPVGAFGVQSQRLAQVPGVSPTSQVQVGAGQFHLIYDDENISMEERRAELNKYRYDEEKIKEQVNRLNNSIESRLSNIKGFTVNG